MTDTEQFFELVRRNDLKRISKLLTRKKVTPFTCKDAKGNTALHIAALNGSLGLIRLLEEIINLHYNGDLEILRSWANESTQDGFLAIHYAVYKGYMKIFKILLKFGSDIKALTNSGLNLMHMAAQGNQPLMLVYLQDLGINPFEKDSKNSSPLHWAAYLGSETAVSVILTWNPELDQQDDDGQTPLHLAVIASNERIIRSLLIKGSSSEIKDNQSKTPWDLAAESNNLSISGLLKPASFLDRCGLKTPLRPISRADWFYIGNLLLFCFEVSICGNLCLLRFGRLALVLYLLNALAVLVLLQFLRFRNPGYITKDEKYSLLKLFELYESHLICPECQVKRPARSRHCQICGKCVEKFDHHCPWINNCVGGRSLGLFLAYTSLTLSCLLASTAILFASISSQPVHLLSSIPQPLSRIMLFLIAFLSCIFTVLVGGLVYIQFSNFLSGQTTNERFSTKYDDTESNEQLFEEKSNKKLWRNFRDMCCNSSVSKENAVEFRKIEEVDSDLTEFSKRLRSK